MARKKKNKSEPDTIPVNPYEPESDPASAGQAGDLQGLSGVATASSESVRELAEEGQGYEAALVSAIENVPDDVSPVKTREVPEDDVPPEYTDRSPDEPKEE